MIACTLRLLRMKILALNCANMIRHDLTMHVVTSLLMLTFGTGQCEIEISLGRRPGFSIISCSFESNITSVQMLIQ